MLLEPVDATGEVGRRLAGRLAAQCCRDVELIARFDGDWPAAGEVPPVRRLPPRLAATPIDALCQARSIARGSFLAVTRQAGGALLAERAFVEKLLRRFRDRPELDAIAFADGGAAGGYAFRPLDSGSPEAPIPHTVVWRRASEGSLAGGLHADPGDVVPSIVRLLVGNGARLDWRHLAIRGGEVGGWREGRWAPIADVGLRSSLDRRRDQFVNEPLLPGPGPSVVPRWLGVPTWTPPQAVLLCRHRVPGGAHRVLTNDRRPPHGYEAEWDLGVLRISAFQGTARLIRVGDEYMALPRGEWHSAPADAVELGYVELAPFPQLDAVALALHRPTGSASSSPCRRIPCWATWT